MRVIQLRQRRLLTVLCMSGLTLMALYLMVTSRGSSAGPGAGSEWRPASGSG